MRRISAGLSAAAFATLLGCSTALAADADAFAQRLSAVMASQGADFEYSAAESDGDDVILRNVVFGEGPGSIDFGDLTFESVSGSTEEGWTVERLPIADFSGTDRPEGSEEPMNYAFSDMSIENIRILGTSPGDDVSPVMQAFSILYDRATIGSIELSEGDTQVFSLSDLTSTNEVADDGSYTGNITAPEFTVTVPDDPEDGSTEAIRALGYDEFTGSMEGQSSWSPGSGTATIAPLSFDVDDVGTLAMTFGIDGYTAEVASALQSMSEQMRENPESQQNAGMAMMGVLSQLQIADITLSFEDASLTQRLIDYYAEQMNQPPEQVIEIAVQIAQGSIQQIGDQAFQSDVTDAVRTFLQDPQSIRVASEPNQPIPVMQVFGAAMGAPQTIPSVLQMTVEANGSGSTSTGSSSGSGNGTGGSQSGSSQ